MRKNAYIAPTEGEEQATLFHMAAMRLHKYPELALLYHIPNGGLRSKSEAGRMRHEGVKSGVPDICLPVARGGFHALYIELKRTKGGKVSENQKHWISALTAAGNCAAVCYGWQEAWTLIENYLEGIIENENIENRTSV